MIEQAKEVAKAIKRIEALDNIDEMGEVSLSIATIAMKAFNGALREKALDIAKAIADFQDELTKASRQ